MKQNLEKSNCIELVHNNSWVPESHWEYLSLHRRDFNSSYML